MPKDEKSEKKFKAVTEELIAETPATEDSKEKEELNPETNLETDVTENVKKDEKIAQAGIAVRETDNINPDSTKKDKSAFLKIFIITFFATLIAFLLAGGIYVYLSSKNTFTSKTEVSTPSPVSSGTATPTPTPVANVDLSTFKISVLNGNGGIGVASALKTIIEKEGFKVSNLSNADNFNFTDTLIQAKSSVSSDVVSKLKNSLDSNYSVKVGSQLDGASSYDIVITVGSK